MSEERCVDIVGTYTVGMMCSNCDYSWVGNFPKQIEVPVKVECPKCCCLQGKKVKP